MMLQRNLLYTAVTRAKQLAVLVGSRHALPAAVSTVRAGRRHNPSPTASPAEHRRTFGR
jgi:exodeoxyribonuclease V alpha subunit